jgi:hypothetical protein
VADAKRHEEAKQAKAVQHAAAEQRKRQVRERERADHAVEILAF